jgi:hypothetical protein
MIYLGMRDVYVHRSCVVLKLIVQLVFLCWCVFLQP